MSHFNPFTPTLAPHPGAPLVRRISTNLTGRDLVVGDVHGCFSKLRTALQAVGFNPDAGDRLFSVGDLVDRGPESEAALWWLAQPWFFAVLGNHELMALEFCRGSAPAGFYAENGGAWLIGKTPPERQPFIDAFAALPLALELETPAGLVCVVHADCPNTHWSRFMARLAMGGDNAEAAMDEAVWSRSRISRLWGDGVADVRAVLVGHTPVERVTSLGNVYYLDTGAWLGRPQGHDGRRPFVLFDAATLAPAYGSALSWAGFDLV